MKNLILSCLFFQVFSASAQTLFTVGGEAVTTEEFKRAFRKNNPADSNAAAVDDYLRLYIRYKLKVKAARALGIDTLPAQRSEAEQFRSQIAEPYMLDAGRIQSLTAEAIERSGADVLVSQVFIPFREEGATLQEREEKTRLMAEQALSALKKGKPFADVAAQYPGSGAIGWITAFTLPYVPESAIWKLPVGGYSAPIQSSAGYHIFLKEAVRPNPGMLSAAHILVAFPPDATAADSLRTAQRADSIYNALEKGASFSELAKQLSDDNASFLQGGELPPFTTGEHTEAFEKAAFALVKDGSISRPIRTEFGYHIIRRMKLVPFSQLSADPLYTETIRQKIYQDSRSEQARDALVDMVIKKAGSRLLVPEKDLFAFSEKNLSSDTLVPFAGISSRTPVLSTGKRKMDALSWTRYVRVARNPLNNDGPPKPYAQLLNDMRRYEAMQYYREHLEEFQPAFAQQFREFKEGNMLFEIMQREVWARSSADSAGLAAFFEKNRGKYYWEPAADAVLFTCADQLAANELKKKITAGPGRWQAITDAMQGRVIADSARMEIARLPIGGNTPLKEHSFTEQVLEADGSILFAYIFKLYPGKQPRTFEEARGFVLNDYQVFLEDNWVKKLEQQYPVVIVEKERKKLLEQK